MKVPTQAFGGGVSTSAIEADRDTLPPMTKSAEREVLHQAKAAAGKRRAIKAPLSWSAALLEAPWGKGLPAAWETAYRRAYAAELVKRGLAVPAAKTGRSGTPGYSTKLMRRLVSATAEEFTEQTARAKAAGLSWSDWARRKLSEE